MLLHPFPSIGMMSNDKLQQQVETALLDSDVTSIRQVLSGVIRERLSAPDPRCSICFLLSAHVEHLLEKWERTCSGYLNAVVPVKDATGKATSDLHRVRNASPGEFNAALGDFFAEMSIVAELAKVGYSEFEPIPTGKAKTVDYRCKRQGKAAALECKNIRAPITVFEAFDRSMKEKRVVHPRLQQMNLVLRIYTDNTVTDEQVAAIDTFMTSLGTGDSPPPALVLPGNVPVEVTVREGHGTTMLFRSMRAGETTPYVDHDKFVAKIRDTVRKGTAQLAVCPEDIHVLGMNIMSPDATIPTEWLSEIREMVSSESGDRVECELMFHYGYLPDENSYCAP